MTKALSVTLHPSVQPVHHDMITLLSGLVEDVGQVATTTVLAIMHSSHEDTGTALLNISI